MSQEQVLALLTYAGLIIGLAINIGSLLRIRGQGRKDTADTYSALSDSVEDLAIESRNLRRENNKLRKQLRKHGVEPENGNGK